jgi:hypothetical protein
MQEKEVRNIADRIAQALSAESKKSDLSTLFASIEKIKHRLDKLEQASSTQIPVPNSPHSSQERFAVAEAIADAIFDHHSKEKACTFEPNGKPCDHCAMCSSRGF